VSVAKGSQACLVHALSSPPNVNKNWLPIFLAKEILHPHLTNYLANNCERDGGALIGNQIFGNKPNIEQSILGYQFFWQASFGVTNVGSGEKPEYGFHLPLPRSTPSHANTPAGCSPALPLKAAKD
jgi:hypothetical protein